MNENQPLQQSTSVPQTPDILQTGMKTEQQPIPPPPPEQPIVPEVPKTKSKLLPVLIILFAILGLGLVGYWVYKNYLTSRRPIIESTPIPIATTDPTANWKTYSNTKYGYSIKYPNGWEPNRGPGNLTDEQISEQNVADFFDPNLPGEDPGTGFNILINELDPTSINKKCTTLDECFSKTFSWLLADTKIEKVATTFLGQPAIEFTYQKTTNLYSQTWKYIYFVYQENAYNIHISTATSRANTIFDIFDQILSTFKFSIQTEDVSNWKIYNSPETGNYISPFQINYPSSWTAKEQLVSAEPTKSLTLILTNQNGETITITQGVGGGGNCIYYDDVDYTTFMGAGKFFSSYIQLSKPNFWRISEPKDSSDKSYIVCGKTKERYIDTTEIGWINIKTESETTLQEVKSILETIVFKPTPETITLFD